MERIKFRIFVSLRYKIPYQITETFFKIPRIFFSSLTDRLVIFFLFPFNHSRTYILGTELRNIIYQWFFFMRCNNICLWTKKYTTFMIIVLIDICKSICSVFLCALFLKLNPLCTESIVSCINFLLNTFLELCHQSSVNTGFSFILDWSFFNIWPLKISLGVFSAQWYI